MKWWITLMEYALATVIFSIGLFTDNTHYVCVSIMLWLVTYSLKDEDDFYGKH